MQYCPQAASLNRSDMELKPTFPSSQLPNLASVSRNSLEVVVFYIDPRKSFYQSGRAEYSVVRSRRPMAAANRSALPDRLAVVSRLGTHCNLNALNRSFPRSRKLSHVLLDTLHYCQSLVFLKSR